MLFRSIRSAVERARVIGRVALLAQPGDPALQKRRVVRAVRGMAVRAIFGDRIVLPQEGAAPVRVARVARLVNAVLDHQLRAVRPVRIVAIGTGHLSGKYWVCRNLMNLGTLGLMTREAHLGLGGRREHAIVLSMDLVTGSAGHVAALMLAPQPIGALAVLVAAEARFGLQLGWCRRSMPEINVYRRSRRGPLGVLYVRLTRSVTGVTARSPRVRFDSVRRLVNGKNRLRLRLVVAPGTDAIALQSTVRLVRQRRRSGAYSQQ